ncbi:MAG: hypothetical protein FWH37_01700 [Candidatus Bathyarchaeota archaeon]|nr:hypothetical protein [Candidatus Termiticorpusculum sp.]
MLSYSDVWNEIIPNIIDNYNLEETLVSVSKNCDIIKEIKKRGKYFYDLIDLPSKSKMFVFYVWDIKKFLKSQTEISYLCSPIGFQNLNQVT